MLNGVLFCGNSAVLDLSPSYFLAENGCTDLNGFTPKPLLSPMAGKPAMVGKAFMGPTDWFPVLALLDGSCSPLNLGPRLSLRFFSRASMTDSRLAGFSGGAAPLMEKSEETLPASDPKLERLLLGLDPE